MAARNLSDDKRLRATWKGQLRLRLVKVPVAAYNAAAKREGEIHFHQLHSACHRRIRYEKICPIHGEVNSDEIVLGYEVAEDQYVVFREKELEKLRSERDKQLNIDRFIHPDDLDPIYYDGRVYYLVPDEAAQDAYNVLRTAIQRRGLYGVGQVVFAGRERLVLIRPLDGLLAMMMLSYENRMRQPELLEDRLSHALPPEEQVALAERLIDASMDSHFELGRYEDQYQRRLRKLIDAKAEGRQIVSAASEEEPETIDFTDALQKSLPGAQSHERQAS